MPAQITVVYIWDNFLSGCVYILLLYVPAQITGVYIYTASDQLTYYALQGGKNPPEKGFFGGYFIRKWGLVSFGGTFLGNILIKCSPPVIRHK